MDYRAPENRTLCRLVVYKLRPHILCDKCRGKVSVRGLRFVYQPNETCPDTNWLVGGRLADSNSACSCDRIACGAVAEFLGPMGRVDRNGGISAID